MIMVTIMEDHQGVLLKVFKERNRTIDGEYYSSFLHKLHREVIENICGMMCSVVLLYEKQQILSHFDKGHLVAKSLGTSVWEKSRLWTVLVLYFLCAVGIMRSY